MKIQNKIIFFAGGGGVRGMSSGGRVGLGAGGQGGCERRIELFAKK